jgi:hypothetical protein
MRAPRGKGRKGNVGACHASAAGGTGGVGGGGVQVMSYSWRAHSSFSNVYNFFIKKKMGVLGVQVQRVAQEFISYSTRAEQRVYILLVHEA